MSELTLQMASLTLPSTCWNVELLCNLAHPSHEPRSPWVSIPSLGHTALSWLCTLLLV